MITRGNHNLVLGLVAALGMGAMFVESVRAEEITSAVCNVRPTKGNKCRGLVMFSTTKDGKVKVTAIIRNLNPDKKHAIHIHQFGDTRDLAGKSAGGHYNPDGKPHGLPPKAERHAGDLGNLEADGEGVAKYSIIVDNISVNGKNGVLGRAIVVHAEPDDGGQPTGNAGARIGYGVIGAQNAEWKRPAKKSADK